LRKDLKVEDPAEAEDGVQEGRPRYSGQRSGINDAAAAVVLHGKIRGAKASAKPLARLVA